MSHIPKERLQKKDLTLTELEHIANCDFCAQSFALFCEEAALPLPLPVKEKIIKKSKIYTPSYKKQQEFRKYCFRVSLSCAGALALIISAKAFESEELQTKDEPFVPGIIKFNQAKDEIKELFTIKEDTNNEKTE